MAQFVLSERLAAIQSSWATQPGSQIVIGEWVTSELGVRARYWPPDLTWGPGLASCSWLLLRQAGPRFVHISDQHILS